VQHRTKWHLCTISDTDYKRKNRQLYLLSCLTNAIFGWPTWCLLVCIRSRLNAILLNIYPLREEISFYTYASVLHNKTNFLRLTLKTKTPFEMLMFSFHESCFLSTTVVTFFKYHYFLHSWIQD